MNCKRCNAPLPSTGYVCSRCGAMMSIEQIQEQKENLKQNTSYNRSELVSEKYGGKKQIFEGRREEKNSLLLIIVMFSILIFLLVIIGIGLFLLK